MKYTIYSIGMLLVALTLFSCEKNETYDYVGGNQVHFEKDRDSSVYSFAIQSSNVNEDIKLIPLGVSGLAAKVDREIKIEVVREQGTAKEGENSASGAHFHLGKTILKAGEIQTNIPVIVFRQSDIKEKEVFVLLRIVTDENFAGGMGDGFLIHKLKINNILTKPDNWDTYIRPYFGDYGPVKYQFVIDELERYDFRDSGDDPVSKAEMVYYRDKLRTALVEFEAEFGPLYEVGNVKVTF
ncbi:MAG: DUF4843 domain-containing protein [Odoribacter sp.]